MTDSSTGHRVRLEPCPRRVRVQLGDAIVADSTAVRYLFETGLPPAYYFPREHVRGELLEPSERTTHCPFKGDATYWHVRAGERLAENAVWAYQRPFEGVEVLEGLVAFYWKKMDHWYEEDEEVFVHPRDPYTRVDVLASSRRVRVALGGRTVGDSTRAMFLFETGLPTRYYLPREDVRMDLLQPTDTRSRCPYKGEAAYWSAVIEGARHEDVAWTYPEPLTECRKIAGLVCFFDERVDAVHVDGERQGQPATKWARR